MIQLFKPCIGEEEIRAVTEVLKSGWIGLGPKTEEFDKQFAGYVNAKYAVSTISCTSALDLAIKLLDLRPQDEIIVPTITFVSTAHAVVYNQCRPVFADVDPMTLNITAAEIKKKITPRTKAIMVVHYSGRPADLDPILEAAGDIPIIEDCAHATGARYKDRHVGTFGRFACFSFHAVKNLTMGEGGALVTSEKKCYERARKLRWLGIDKGTWERTDDNRSYWWEYSVDEIGLKCHSNDIMAAIGLEQLKKIEMLNRRRNTIAERYREAFNHLDWLEMPCADEKNFASSWHLCCVRTKGINRDDLSFYLKEKGIATGVHYKPIHLYPCYGYQEKLPVAEEVFQSLLSIPNHPSLTDDEAQYIVDSIRSFPV